MNISKRVERKIRYSWISRSAIHPLQKESRWAVEDLKKQGYYSQWGQDKWVVEELFQGKRAGVFVDVGAYDGITFSNTYYLEERLGWTGIAIEPTPDAFAALARNRRCLTVQGCVAESSGEAAFRWITGESEMLSGLVDRYDPRFVKRIEREIAQTGDEVKEIAVASYTLNDLLDKHQIDRIDYMSMDIEGGELQALKGMDLNRFRVQVISVENNYRDFYLAEFLKDKGYFFHSVVGKDEFYVRRK